MDSELQRVFSCTLADDIDRTNGSNGAGTDTVHIIHDLELPRNVLFFTSSSFGRGGTYGCTGFYAVAGYNPA